MTASKRLIVGMTGASGVAYGVRMLEALRELGVETHLVMTEAAQRVVSMETGREPSELWGIADFHYLNDQIDAPIASGSFRTMGMAVVPCSVKSLSAIAHCFSDTLLVRAADCTIKERRCLVLAVRETPLHLGHLRLMTAVTEYGAIVLPLAPGFYHDPKTLEQLIDHSVGKVLDQFSLEHGLYRRWEGDGGSR